MRFTVLAVGRLRPAGLRDLADEYGKRIRRHARLEEVELRAVEELSGALPPGARCVALEVSGEMLGSRELARRLEHWGSTGKGHVAFLIGGADGLPARLSARAEHRLSLSALTLPHRLARLILLEQLYRSLCILRGEPYARED